MYLFPNMLDQYQNQLTRLLESEQYGEAKELLRFLLHCQGEEKRHYDEWSNLLNWLDVAFPGYEGKGNGNPSYIEDEENEATIREQALIPNDYDEDYVQQVLYVMKHHPVADQQLLALERAAYLTHPGVDEEILTWLTGTELHPELQFKALQCLKKRGVTGTVGLERMGEFAELEIEETPLSLDEFPPVAVRVAERVESVTEVVEASMPHFARELWKECLQCIYGTTAYERLRGDDDETVDCFAAALHQVLELSLYGRADDDDIRETYGITDALRFRYEQACRTLRQTVQLRLEEGGDKS